MIRRHIRRAAAALALAAVLALATPAHAAGWHAWTAGPDWLESALQWIAGIWRGDGNGTERGVKAGHGIDPNGDPVPATNPGGDPSGATTPTSVDPGSDRGSGIDPDG